MRLLHAEPISENTGGLDFPTRHSGLSTMSRPSLAPAKASSIAPGLRELRLWELPSGAVGQCQLHSHDHVTLTGVRGQCWVTQQGDRHDYLLAPGKTLSFQGPGRLVFEAVADDAALAVS